MDTNNSNTTANATGAAIAGKGAAMTRRNTGKVLPDGRVRPAVDQINRQAEKTPMPEQAAPGRIANFDEVALGYTPEMAVNEARRCLNCPKPHCMEGCPVGVPIPHFIEAVAAGDFAQAYRTIKRRNALPAICGRVCPQETQCEARCVLGRKGQPVGIGYLERFVADWAFAHADEVRESQRFDGRASDPDAGAPSFGQSAAGGKPETAASRNQEPAATNNQPAAADNHGVAGAFNQQPAADCDTQPATAPSPAKQPRRKVACIGSGPSSLTCADTLACSGVDVTVFEALHKVGGVLSYGIPEFRLPKRLVAREIDTLTAHGVHFEVNAVVGRLYDIPELMGQMGYDAVYIASGAGAPIYLNIEDEMYDGVMMANELLTRTNLMKAFEFPAYATPLYMGRTCAVIGGGNVAMDAARTVRRFGADVTIVYRRSRNELPARKEEVEHAEQEGVQFRFLTNPVRIEADDRGWVTRLKCVKMKLGEPDASGRRRPIEIPGSEFPMNVDMVVVAVGNRPNQLVQHSTPGLAVDDRGRIITDPYTHATNLPGVFAGGDVTTGAATVIQAMGTGKEAAAAILDYLNVP